MPYVICSRCNVRTYSAALWMATEECPSCGADLPPGGGRVVPIAAHPRFLKTVRDAVPGAVEGSPEADHE